MAQQGILAQEDARIGLQGVGGGRQTLRSRIPTATFSALEAQDGEYFHWTVYTDMKAAMAHTPQGVGVVVGYIIAEEDARPRNIIAEKQEGAAKSAAKKGASKKPMKKGGVKVARKAAPDEDDPFGGDDPEDDGSEPPKRRVAVALPKKTAVSVVRRPTVASGRSPRVAGAIAKPGVTRRARKGGGVRYSNE